MYTEHLIEYVKKYYSRLQFVDGSLNFFLNTVSIRILHRLQV